MEQQERARRLAELQKQRAELDKMISELSTEENRKSHTGIETNIPYTHKYLEYFGTKRPTRLGSANPSALLEMKIFVNKKCNQISADYSHTIGLINEIQPVKADLVFQELFVHKLIEQGRSQVAAHLDSYKPLSYILTELNIVEMVSDYVHLAITRKGNEQELCGIYAIYFGYLNLKEDLPACWVWLASVLNCGPNQVTGYVLEVFLGICGQMLAERCAKFGKLVVYIEKFFLAELPVEPVRVRIQLVLNKYKQFMGK